MTTIHMVVSFRCVDATGSPGPAVTAGMTADLVASGAVAGREGCRPDRGLARRLLHVPARGPLGADVIKIEDPGAGDYMRSFGVQVEGQAPSTTSSTAATFGRH